MKKILMLLIGLLFVVTFSCNKDENESIPVFDDPEALPETELQMLESLNEAEGFDHSTVILPNGEILYDFLMEVDPDFVNQWLVPSNKSRLKSSNIKSKYKGEGPQAAKNQLIGKITSIALNLTNKEEYQYPYEADDKPAQDGLAYSWGGKDHTIRQKPPGSNTACNHKIYGLDCSGFIHQVFKNAGVNMKIGPANAQRNPEYVESIIQSSIPELNKIKVEDLGSIPTSEFESGDIIYWTNNDGRATHIGIILKKENGDLAVFQSNGSTGKNSDDCSNNLSSTRGVHRFELNDPYWFGSTKKYGITRINADISGKWTFFLRCEGMSSDLFTLDVDFPTTENNSFQLTKTAVDYDGSVNTFYFTFTYNNSTNVLACEYTMTDSEVANFERKDSFSLKLNRDDSGYIIATNEYINGGTGCTEEVRLVNNDVNSVSKSVKTQGKFSNKTATGLK